MPAIDNFDTLARFYDPIMDHVDYDRWFLTTTALGELLPRDFLHADVACGTGVLMGMLRKAGWRTIGVDLSPAMAREARRARGLEVAAADMRALPFRASLDCITCLFDSINFVLEEEGVRRALGELSGSLAPRGLLYFDIVTERMVTEYFEGQDWSENNGGFTTHWHSTYDRKQQLARTEVQVNTGSPSLIEERIYPQDWLAAEVEAAGLDLLAVFDAETWRKPGRRATRVDFIAMKGAEAADRRTFQRVAKEVRRYLKR